MVRYSQKLLVSFFSALFLAGCGTFEQLVDVPVKPAEAVVDEYDISLFQNSIHLFSPVSVGERAERLKLEQRIENLFVLVDELPTSDSYRTIPLDIYQREIFRRLNRTIPRLPLRGGAWKLGGEGVPKQFGSYQPTAIENNLDRGESLPYVGTSNLAVAIDRVADLASPLTGRSAILLISTWDRMDKGALEAVARFRQRGLSQQGFRVIPSVDPWKGSNNPYCVFVIGTGNSLSRSLVESADTCGAAEASDKIMQPRDMAHFVEKVLYMGPADTDQDGVYDYKDKCPGTPADRLIGFDGCARFAADTGL